MEEVRFVWSKLDRVEFKSLLYYFDKYRGFSGFRKYLIGLFQLVGMVFARIMRAYFRGLLMILGIVDIVSLMRKCFKGSGIFK